MTVKNYAEQKTYRIQRDRILCDFIHKHFNKHNKSMWVDLGKGHCLRMREEVVTNCRRTQGKLVE